MAPNAPICQGNEMLQSKYLLWIEEVSREGCLEEAGLRLKLEKQSGLNHGSLQMAGP